MPQMGESIFEGTITKWLKKVGDAVEKDEPLFEISTDKVDAEIPVARGRHAHRDQGPRGRDRQVNTVVAVIGGASVRRLRAPAASSAASRRRSPSRLQAAKPQSTAPRGAAVERTAQALRSSPLVRRIAKENNLDLHQVPGTGSNGRITKEDILALSQPARLGSAAAARQPATRAAAASR